MIRRFMPLAALILLSLPSPGADASAKSPATSATESSPTSLLWREPVDLASRSLYYGIGGEKHQPHGPYTFVEEDLNGTNPKYVVLDRDNIKWTVKLGIEARPETAASRLVWGAGYFADEDYFIQDLQVGQMPSRLKRGGNLVGPGGSMHAARLKRHIEGEKNTGDWKWRDNPFTGSRELNGLKVMMALMNNWDLKDVNNKILASKDSHEPVYIVSDLGATFGATSMTFPFSHSKGDLKSYARSKFISKITPEYLDFRTPSPPALIYAFLPVAYARRTRLDNVVHHIPRDDARWIGQILSQLSVDQIHDAFRAGGYTSDDAEAFTRVIQARIAELKNL